MAASSRKIILLCFRGLLEASGVGGGGVLPYINYIGMCRPVR